VHRCSTGVPTTARLHRKWGHEAQLLILSESCLRKPETGNGRSSIWKVPPNSQSECDSFEWKPTPCSNWRRFTAMLAISARRQQSQVVVSRWLAVGVFAVRKPLVFRTLVPPKADILFLAFELFAWLDSTTAPPPSIMPAANFEAPLK
jgi:hypothetical protein